MHQTTRQKISKEIDNLNNIINQLNQESPNPGPRTGTRTRPHSRRWAAGEQVKLHLYLQLLPIILITTWAPPPVRSAVALDSHRSTNPTMNCTCKGSRLHAPYENLMPDDLRWSWGGDARLGSGCKYRLLLA